MTICGETTAPDVTHTQTLIREWIDETPTGVLSRNRVIDKLLDLRNVVPEPDRGLVDATLTSVPGLTLVESEWWTTTLSALSDAIRSSCEQLDGDETLVVERGDL